MLKVVKRPKSPYLYLRGTVRGLSIEESTGVTDWKIAEEIKVKREAELLTESIWGKATSVSFAHAVADYLEHGAGNPRFLQPLLDQFQTTLLRNIDQHAIDIAATKLYAKAKPATRNRQVYTPVSAILHHAARKGWCDPPLIARPKQPKGVVRWIKPDEAERLIEACAEHLRPLVIFMLYTGARVGEAVWLDWSNVDLGKAQVTFPKTKNGEPRSVPLHPRVVQVIANLSHREGEVFRKPSGEPYARPKGDADTSAGSRIHTAFSGARERAGVENFRVHDCRHTWATWHYQANRDLTALQTLGGWKTVAMVLRYAHTNVAEHAQGIDNLPWGNPGEQSKGKAANGS
ncbi:MAG: site-specific integrase [Roseiarcus sp.]|jgi:integrase